MKLIKCKKCKKLKTEKNFINLKHKNKKTKLCLDCRIYVDFLKIERLKIEDLVKRFTPKWK